jgi:hypothetical protein
MRQHSPHFLVALAERQLLEPVARIQLRLKIAFAVLIGE